MHFEFRHVPESQNPKPTKKEVIKSKGQKDNNDKQKKFKSYFASPEKGTNVAYTVSSL